MTARELREKRGSIFGEMKKLREEAEGRLFTAEEQEKWEAINADFDALGPLIERAERVESLEEWAAAPQDDAVSRALRGETRDGRDPLPDTQGDRGQGPPDTRTLNLAINAWCRAQYDVDPTEEEREAAQRCRINPRSRELELDLPQMTRQYRRELEQRAGLVAGTATEGAEFIPEGFVNALEISLLAFGGMRQASTIIRTATGNDMPYPTTNDTANTGALLSEATTIGTSVDPATAAVTLLAYKYSSKLLQVSPELIQDSAFDVASMVGMMLGERIGRIQNTHFTTGDGSSKPSGIITGASTGKTTASATAIAADEIFDLVHSVDPAYRSQPGAGFMFHDNILLYIRKLKGVDSQYIWQPGLAAGEQDRLLGFPYFVNQDMASSIATTNVTMVFGALRKYLIRDAGTIRLRRLVERYADIDMEGFVAFMRSDGRVLDAGTDPIKDMTQA
jgi:HK97 family phage major capsid protein